MPWGVAAAAVGAYGAIKSSQNNKEAAAQGTTTQQELDPRVQAMLFGDGTSANQGLLSQYQSYLNNPQSAGTQTFGQAAQNYLGANANILDSLNQGAKTLLNGGKEAIGGFANGTTGASVLPNSGATVNAPAQNGVNLSQAYQNTIYGDAGANPYLTNSLQSAVDQTNTAYQKNQTDLTNNLQRTVLPGISSNAILSGAFGGSRQGIAEGNALSDYTNQLTNANLQLAQTNSANTTGAQAQAYNQGQDRALSALNTLSGQQYGVASQNAANQQQANLQNQSLANQTNQFNSNLAQNNEQFNAQMSQNNQQFNAAQANQNTQAGLAAQSGLLSSLYGYAQNQDNAQINRATQVNGLLAPYLSANATTVQTSPYYSNTAGNILGGASAGLGLYNGIKNTFGNNTASSGTYANNDWFTS